jgi:uncharacterized RDD family membrane protein YckC
MAERFASDFDEGDDPRDDDYDIAGDISHFPYAGFRLRFIAFLFDYVIVLVVMVPIGYGWDLAGAWAFGPPLVRPISVQFGLGAIGFVSGAVGHWLYDACLESSRFQATLGKQAIGIKVTDLEGRRISFLSSLTLGIGYIMAGITEKKQALHDIIAETLALKGRGGDGRTILDPTRHEDELDDRDPADWPGRSSEPEDRFRS